MGVDDGRFETDLVEFSSRGVDDARRRILEEILLANGKLLGHGVDGDGSEAWTLGVVFGVVGGGGATELACSIAVAEEADKIRGVEQYAVRAFADALEEIPLTLAENSGYNPIEYVSKLREEQKGEDNPFIGVDANHKGSTNMHEQGIYESVMSKR